VLQAALGVALTAALLAPGIQPMPALAADDEQWRRASSLRSEALNRLYGLDGQSTAGAASSIRGPKDYSKNTATGDYAPPSAPPIEVIRVAQGRGFAWGHAAVGAGLTLILSLVALGAATTLGRRHGDPHASEGAS
jgi:hypothetical protein